jgi:hypothetical protein
MTPNRPLLTVLLAACVVPAPVSNPSGICTAEDDGARGCYHSPSTQDTYLPDCEAPLDRELWRVFQQVDGTAYIIPRPDATGLQFGICDGDDADLAALFAQYDLCAEVVTDPAVVNAMLPADALNITHALHERLFFEAVEDNGNWAISPWAPDNDMADACDVLTEPEPALCQGYRERRDVGPNEACSDGNWVPDEETVKALAPALNAAYGIEDI